MVDVQGEAAAALFHDGEAQGHDVFHADMLVGLSAQGEDGRSLHFFSSLHHAAEGGVVVHVEVTDAPVFGGVEGKKFVHCIKGHGEPRRGLNG